MDVVLQLPDAKEEDTRERVRDLLFLKKLIFGFPRVERLHRRILEEKFELVRGLGWGAGEWGDGDGDGRNGDSVGRDGEGGWGEEGESRLGVRGLVELL